MKLREVLSDPEKRRIAGIIAFVLTPGIVVGLGIWGTSYAISSSFPEKPSCQPTKVQGPIQNSFVTNVVNASDAGGVATAVSKELPLRDFQPGEVGNDNIIERAGKVSGVGEIRFGPQGFDQALVTRKLLMPDAKLIKDFRDGTTVDLVIGPDFKSLAPHDGPLVRRTDVVVNVYNTTYFEGLAAKTAEGLIGFGFRQGKTGLDPQRSWITEIAAIRYGPDSETAAKLLQEAVPGSTLQLEAGKPGTSIDLLIGMKWAGLGPADKLTPQEPKKPLGPIEVERPCMK
ncbi:LytR C-terminal domain-containing protein [Austwickia chelonae]|uniref:LytR C-terminal domain-containing protein n=1 Tax=Austwickia chelonae TaxID=100225 RepID=UPI0013C30451|nr:LytR C-terminal domain-containing protein [Austwickia chelonae]